MILQAALVMVLGLTQDEFQQGLATLVGLRAGEATSRDEVEAKLAELTQRFTAPEELGEIYYAAAHIYAQTGLKHPDLVVQHSRTALETLTAPDKRIRLYVYLGDGMMALNRSLPEDERKSRKEATRDSIEIYMEGLQEAETYNVPEERPEIGSMTRLSEDATAEERQEAYVEYEEASAKVHVQQNIHKYRWALRQQVGWRSSRFRTADADLAAALAKYPLGDKNKAAVEESLTRNAEKYPLTPDPEPEPQAQEHEDSEPNAAVPATPANTDYRPLGILAALAVLFFMGYRFTRSQARRSQASKAA